MQKYTSCKLVCNFFENFGVLREGICKMVIGSTIFSELDAFDFDFVVSICSLNGLDICEGHAKTSQYLSSIGLSYFQPIQY